MATVTLPLPLHAHAVLFPFLAHAATSPAFVPSPSRETSAKAMEIIGSKVPIITSRNPFLGDDRCRRRSRTNRATGLLLSNKSDYDKNNEESNIWNGIANLWDEVIEMSTYGPGERRMLRSRRERQRELARMNNDGDGAASVDIAAVDGDDAAIFAPFDASESDDDRAWLEAFASARGRSDDERDNNDEDDTTSSDRPEYDGYQLRDLLLSKWGVPLDVDFQRINAKIYCTILPAVGYGGGLQSRHESELDYLMHLQGVVEVLCKYDNLNEFVAFIEATDRVPRRGTDSVPFRLNLSGEDIDRITS